MALCGISWVDRILIETDAPVILPYCKDTIPSKLLRRARDTSMILQEVLKKIAELKDILAETVEVITTQNVIRLVGLAIEAQNVSSPSSERRWG